MKRTRSQTTLILITASLLSTVQPAISSAKSGPKRIKSDFPECDDVYLVNEADAKNMTTPDGCSAVAGVPDVSVFTSTEIPDKAAEFAFLDAVTQQVSRDYEHNAKVDATENLPCFTSDASKYQLEPGLDTSKYGTDQCRNFRDQVRRTFNAGVHELRVQLAIASAAKHQAAARSAGYGQAPSIYSELNLPLNTEILNPSEKSKIFKEPLTAAEKAEAKAAIRAMMKGREPSANDDIALERKAESAISQVAPRFHLLMTLPTPKWSGDDKSQSRDPSWTDDEFASSIKQSLDFEKDQKIAADKSADKAKSGDLSRLEETDSHRFWRDTLPFFVGDQCNHKDASARPLSCYAANIPAMREVLRNDKAHHAEFCRAAALWKSWNSARDTNFMVGELAATTVATLPVGGVFGVGAKAVGIAAKAGEAAEGTSALAAASARAGVTAVQALPGIGVGAVQTGNQLDEIRQTGNMARAQVASNTELRDGQKSVREDDDINKAASEMHSAAIMAAVMPLGFGAVSKVGASIGNAIVNRLARAAVAKTESQQAAVIADMRNLIEKSGWTPDRIDEFKAGLDNTKLSEKAKARLRASLDKAENQVAETDLKEIQDVRFPEYMRLLKDKKEMRELASAIRSAHERWMEAYEMQGKDAKSAGEEAWKIISKKLSLAKQWCTKKNPA